MGPKNYHFLRTSLKFSSSPSSLCSPSSLELMKACLDEVVQKVAIFLMAHSPLSLSRRHLSRLLRALAFVQTETKQVFPSRFGIKANLPFSHSEKFNNVVI